ncbi:MAG: MoxR family ATPase [Spirochaetaceae bacterium]|jgi:MoxR-like ATPase|nr:MoxR family ATPase [Spirochaetaceae bacterium]
MNENLTITDAAEKINRIKTEVGKTFIGQTELVEKALITLLAEGHLLVEGVPGLGKTLLVLALAKSLGAQSSRIQFTPDLMPSDITGNIMLDSASGKFVTKKGPVFTNILIADELNRAPAKTQAALFEAMQEYQVSLDGVSYRLPEPFMVLATENPLEHEGTYPLPDAQKDRFLMKVILPYPTHEEEKEMVSLVLSEGTGAKLSVDAVTAVTNPAEFSAMQKIVSSIKIDHTIIDYAVRLCFATRDAAMLQNGAGPRGSLALLRSARAKALIEDRDFVIPDDIKILAPSVLAHRISLSAESELEGKTETAIIEDIINETEAPRT